MSTDKLAKADEWLVFVRGEVYEKTLSKESSIYIIKEEKTWTVWVGTWMKGRPLPIREKTIISNASFERALKRANGYVTFIRQKQKGVKE